MPTLKFIDCGANTIPTNPAFHYQDVRGSSIGYSQIGFSIVKPRRDDYE